MRIAYRKQDHRALGRGLLAVVVGLFVLSGCEERDSSDGEVINNIVLPTDVVLNLACDDVGINDEQCVLDDPENPFAVVPTFEFDVNNPDGPSKFDLALEIPPGPTGAKARFYLWATALARRPSGENQWYTARALHELFDANSNPASKDEIVRAQALRAYRSVLDNFFGSAIVTPFGPLTLNEQVAKDLLYEDQTGYQRLVDLPLINTIDLLTEWGYAYDEDIDLLRIIIL